MQVGTPLPTPLWNAANRVESNLGAEACLLFDNAPDKRPCNVMSHLQRMWSTKEGHPCELSLHSNCLDTRPRVAAPSFDLCSSHLARNQMAYCNATLQYSVAILTLGFEARRPAQTAPRSAGVPVLPSLSHGQLQHTGPALAQCVMADRASLLESSVVQQSLCDLRSVRLWHDLVHPALVTCLGG